MKTVYVAGPVERRNVVTRSPQASRIYHDMVGLQHLGCEVRLPIAEYALELASPAQFYHEIAARIKASDVLVSVLPEINPSSGIESTVAAFMNKPQYIITGSEREIPRLVLGLPNHQGVYDATDIERLMRAITRLENEDPPMMMMQG